jgi:hypothetical protein
MGEGVKVKSKGKRQISKGKNWKRKARAALSEKKRSADLLPFAICLLILCH